jgi:long-chain acyl-CoA synthetase
MALTSESTVHVLSRPEPEAVAEALRRQRLESAVLPAPLAKQLLGSNALQQPGFESLGSLFVGSSPVAPATVWGLARAVPRAQILLGYGSTEAAPAFTRLAGQAGLDGYKGTESDPCSLGSPAPGTQVAILDESGAQLPAGAVGEIALRSDAPQRSYFGDPDATRKVFDGGWTRMGDLGRLDADGVLHFFDRKSQVIVSAGETISSARIENALLWHPAVVDAAAFAESDPAAGTVPACAVELRRPVDPAELRDFLTERLAPHELPVHIDAVKRLPRNPLGKVVKSQIIRTQTK